MRSGRLRLPKAREALTKSEHRSRAEQRSRAARFLAAATNARRRIAPNPRYSLCRRQTKGSPACAPPRLGSTHFSRGSPRGSSSPFFRSASCASTTASAAAQCSSARPSG